MFCMPINDIEFYMPVLNLFKIILTFCFSELSLWNATKIKSLK